ncbi:hypothetical protein, partial [Nocardia nova]|uniref:hypothetical protein n=1 Tax=Nocardia nova TaxID=37330 RepID=UPI0025B0FEDC
MTTQADKEASDSHTSDRQAPDPGAVTGEADTEQPTRDEVSRGSSRAADERRPAGPLRRAWS